jgi:hypothetical protein
MDAKYMKHVALIRSIIRNSLAIIVIALSGALVSYAATNIDTQGVGEKWGWNNVFGWVDMAITNTVNVSSSTVAGYASSSIGDIMFDCASTRAGNTCATANFKTANDGTGLLSGWAWNDLIGWISMSGTTGDGQAYQVHIDPAGDNINSYFNGWAWSDVVGWITFNCNDYGAAFCSATSTYKTQTSAGASPMDAEFVSSIFDIGTTTGLLNTITWHGSQPSGTSVKFQIATATSTAALSGSASTVFAGSNWIDVNPAPASPVRLTPSVAGVPVENRQYFRYRAALATPGTSGLQIDDIIVNWSP